MGMDKLEKLNRAIFLDRDGVINRVLLNNGRPFSPRRFDDFELLPEIKEALNSFMKMGFVNIVITNQPDIARGLMEMEELNRMHAMLRERLAINDIMACFHDNGDNCICRKPKPGMILVAANKWNINLRRSFVIGDTWRDVEAGKKGGCKTILIDMPYNQGVESDHRVKDLEEAVEIIKLSVNSYR